VMNANEDHLDIEEQLESLDRERIRLYRRCRYRSARRVADEIRRLARSNQQLIWYLYATFNAMAVGIYLLDPERTRDLALELISLLEDEDAAMRIQSDYSRPAYDDAVYQLTTCGYDNLATAIGMLHGYNSDGTHACISDGFEICRRTGQLACITCFQEYATDVYLAADDLEMATHFARRRLAGDGNRNRERDRRWVGASDLYRIALYRGQPDDALHALERMWELCESWHSPLYARLVTRYRAAELSHVTGDDSLRTRFGALENDGAAGADRAAEPADETPPEGEFPRLDMLADHVAALGDCREGRYEAAVERLHRWDRQLLRCGALDCWFENRLRLLAVLRLKGDSRSFDMLADQLAERARTARDWISLHCLEQVRVSSTPAPVPLLADLPRGPFAGGTTSDESRQRSNDRDRPSGERESEAAAAESSSTVPPPLVAEFIQRMEAAYAIDDAEARAAAETEIRRDLLRADAATSDEAAWLISIARQIGAVGEDAVRLWHWAQAVAKPYMKDATVVSVLAHLAMRLRFGDDPAIDDSCVTETQIESWFRSSLDLAPDHSMNFLRAGEYFAMMEDQGEAERCFARAFRLNRQNGEAARRLADIYRRTNRDQDALTVLDLSLREGSEHPAVAWSAGNVAFQLEQYERALTYFDAYERLVPGQPWVNYFRASALLQLQRPDDAMAAAAEEARRNEENRFATKAHLACATAQQGDVAAFRTMLEEILAVPLYEVALLTATGLASVFRLLRNAASGLPEDDPLRQRLDDHLVSAGLAPNELFAAHRKGEPCEDLGYYICRLRQPLDDQWERWPGRLADEPMGTSYETAWGVLARNDEEAEEIALQWQRKAYPLSPHVLDTSLQGEGYRDVPGVVWQGARQVNND